MMSCMINFQIVHQPYIPEINPSWSGGTVPCSLTLSFSGFCPRSREALLLPQGSFTWFIWSQQWQEFLSEFLSPGVTYTMIVGTFKVKPPKKKVNKNKKKNKNALFGSLISSFKSSLKSDAFVQFPKLWFLFYTSLFFF